MPVFTCRLSLVSKLRRGPVVELILVGTVLAAACIGCGGEPFKRPGADLLGIWTAEGTSINIKNETTADLIGKNTVIVNGDVRLYKDGRDLMIGDQGVFKTFKIDTPPSGGQMTLDGVVFKRGGQMPASDKVPGDAEIEARIKDTIANYARAVEAGSLGDFFKDKKDQYDKDLDEQQLKTIRGMGDRGLASLRGVAGSTVKFARPPMVGIDSQGGVIWLKGSFDSKPSGVTFEAIYVLEKRSNEWIITSLQINL